MLPLSLKLNLPVSCSFRHLREAFQVSQSSWKEMKTISLSVYHCLKTYQRLHLYYQMDLRGIDLPSLQISIENQSVSCWQMGRSLITFPFSLLQRALTVKNGFLCFASRDTRNKPIPQTWQVLPHFVGGETMWLGHFQWPKQSYICRWQSWDINTVCWFLESSAVSATPIHEQRLFVCCPYKPKEMSRPDDSPGILGMNH